MLVYPPGSSEPLRGDVVVRATIRFDLLPIPATLHLIVRDVKEADGIVEGVDIKAGRLGQSFRIVKETGVSNPGFVQGSRTTGTREFIGLLSSCAPLAMPRQRAVIAYKTDLLSMVRACGASAIILGSVRVDAFACLIGQTPAFGVARALQESGSALVVEPDGRLAFKRLQDLQSGTPTRTTLQDSAEVVESAMLEKSAVPWAFSIAPDGKIVHGRRESGRISTYMPWASQATLSNASMALVTRRILTSIYAPDLHAGQVVSLGGKPLVIVTAAHTLTTGGGGAEGKSETKLWLGRVEK
jgi:hypothetical protein